MSDSQSNKSYSTKQTTGSMHLYINNPYAAKGKKRKEFDRESQNQTLPLLKPVEKITQPRNRSVCTKVGVPTLVTIAALGLGVDDFGDMERAKDNGKY